MAKFITNSTSTEAIRLERINVVLIREAKKRQGEVELPGWELVVNSMDNDNWLTFEIGDTINEVQSLAVPLMAALEA